MAKRYIADTFEGIATTVVNDAITNAKLANMAVNTIKGRITAGTGDPEDLTATQVRTIITDASNSFVTDTEKTNWNTAYGWGNHAGLYLGINAKAADSNLLDGIDSTGFILNQQASAQSANMRISGSGTFGATIQATTAKLTNLTDGYLPYHISDDSGLGNSPIYTDGTNVGIGTTGPISKLQVNIPTKTGVSQTGLTVSLSDNSLPLAVADAVAIDIAKSYSGVNYPLGRIASSNSGQDSYNDGYLSFSTQRSGTMTEAMRILDTGNVGIGYSSGTEIINNRLAVNGSGYFNGSVTATEFLGNATSDTLTTTVSITNATLTDGGYTQSGKVVLIANGVNTINYTINAGITASFVKGGTGAITFVQGAGRTLVNVYGLVYNGAVGSTASIASFGTTDYLYINNA